MAEDTKLANKEAEKVDQAALAVDEQDVKKKVAKKQTTIIPKAGNTEEYNKLEEELKKSTYREEHLKKNLFEKTKECDEWRTKYCDTKKALDLSIKENMELKTARNQSADAKSEFVQIVAIPPKGLKPSPVKVNGVPAPFEVDEDGCYKFTVPKENAIKLMASIGGTKYCLVGPVESIEATVPDGLYTKTVVFKKHAKNKSSSDVVTWYPVEYEEKNSNK